MEVRLSELEVHHCLALVLACVEEEDSLPPGVLRWAEVLLRESGRCVWRGGSAPEMDSAERDEFVALSLLMAKRERG